MKHALGVAPSWRAESVYSPQLASAKYQCRSNQRSSRHPGEPVRRADAYSQPVRRMHARWGRESAGTCDARSEQLYTSAQRKLRLHSAFIRRKSGSPRLITFSGVSRTGQGGVEVRNGGASSAASRFTTSESGRPCMVLHGALSLHGLHGCNHDGGVKPR